MPKIITGHSGLKDRQERDSRDRMGEFIPFLRLSEDGDSVKFRIVSSHEPDLCDNTGIPSFMISATFHRHEALSSNGRRYFTTTLCSLDEEEDGTLTGHCNLCDEDVRRSLQFMVWVYVYHIDHSRQNDDPQDKWEEVSIGSYRVYREKIEKFMIWQDGFFSAQALEGRIMRYQSITDRDYERIRHGGRGNPQVRYELEGGDTSPIPNFMVEQSQDLPDLIAVAEKRVTTMNGGNPMVNKDDTRTEYREVARPSRDYTDLPF